MEGGKQSQHAPRIMSRWSSAVANDQSEMSSATGQIILEVAKRSSYNRALPRSSVPHACSRICSSIVAQLIGPDAGDLETATRRPSASALRTFRYADSRWQPVTRGPVADSVEQHHMLSLGTNQNFARIHHSAGCRGTRPSSGNRTGFPVGRKQMRDIRHKSPTSCERGHSRSDHTRAWLILETVVRHRCAGAPRADQCSNPVATLDSFVPAPLEGARSPDVFMDICSCRAMLPLNLRSMTIGAAGGG